MRHHWTLDPDVVYLNHGSFGAVPRVTQETQRRLAAASEANPMKWFRELPPRLLRTREDIATWLGTSADSIALLPNATTGISSALRSVRSGPGSRFVLTDHGYGAVWLAAEHVAARTGATVEIVPLPLDASDDDVVAILDPFVDERTAALVVDQITSPTAKLLPVGRLAEVGRRRGVAVIVDGAHAPGLVDMPVAGDFWTGNLHKWPCAPRGTGVLFVDPSRHDAVVPPVVSWDQPRGFPVSFDYPGTTDVTGWLATPTSLRLLDELGFAARRKEIGDLLETGATLLADSWGGRVVDVGVPAPTMRLVTAPEGVVAEPADCSRLGAFVAAQTGVETAPSHWGGVGYFRLSAHLYSTIDDFTVAADRLGRLFADRDRVRAAIQASR